MDALNAPDARLVGLPRTLRVLALGTMLGPPIRDPLVTPDHAIGSDRLPLDTPCTTCNGEGDSPSRTPKAGVGRSNRLGGTVNRDRSFVLSSRAALSQAPEGLP